MADRETIRTEDVVSVGSRMSWGAVLAGAMVAVAVHVLLTLLGAAFGFTVMNANTTEAKTAAMIGAAWCLFSCCVAFFLGGWVASQMTVGENRTEAVIHAVVLWGVAAVALIWMASVGLRTGVVTMMGLESIAADRGADTRSWAELGRRAGLTQEQIEEGQRRLDRGLDDPANRETARQTARNVAWWAFAAVLVSMAAAIAGALTGAGPQLRLLLLERSEMAIMTAEGNGARAPLTRV